MAGGTGDVAFRMARRGAQVTVADINADMLEVGQQRAAERGIDGLDWQVEDAQSLTFADRSFDAYTIAFGIRNVTDIPAALARGAPRADPRRALLLPRILDQRLARFRRALRSLFAPCHPAHRQGGRRRRSELSLSGRIDPPLPQARSVPADDRRRPASRASPSSRCSAAWSRSTRAGRFDRFGHPPVAPAQMGPDARPPRRAARASRPTR